MSRILTYGHKLDDILERILGRDDVEALRIFVNNTHEDNNFDGALVSYAMRACALNCTIALLRGDYGKPAEYGPEAVCEAAYYMCDPQVTKLLLENRGAGYQCNRKGFIDVLPLDLVLVDLPFYIRKHLSTKWSPGESFIKLILLLCHPALKPQMECARMIADYTKPLIPVARSYLLHGHLAGLTALLIVHPEEAMAAFRSDGIIKQPKSLMPSDKLSAKVNNDRINAWSHATELFEIFDKAGVELSQCYWSLKEEVPSQDIIIQVANVIQKAGIAVIHKDIMDLTDVYRFEPQVKEYIFSKLGIEMEGTSTEFQTYQQHMRPSDNSINSKNKGVLNGTNLLEPNTSTLFNYQMSRPFSTASPALKISSRNYPRAFSSMGGIAHLAMKFKKGMRFL